uniref:Uncharacterized protein n=1 Tax=Acrobeloides nanus TaxID=290746 RepID=A0A914DDY7_9BILA
MWGPAMMIIPVTDA